MSAAFQGSDARHLRLCSAKSLRGRCGGRSFPAAGTYAMEARRAAVSPPTPAPWSFATDGSPTAWGARSFEGRPAAFPEEGDGADGAPGGQRGAVAPLRAGPRSRRWRPAIRETASRGGLRPTCPRRAPAIIPARRLHRAGSRLRPTRVGRALRATDLPIASGLQVWGRHEGPSVSDVLISGAARRAGRASPVGGASSCCPSGAAELPNACGRRAGPDESFAVRSPIPSRRQVALDHGKPTRTGATPITATMPTDALRGLSRCDARGGRDHGSERLKSGPPVGSQGEAGLPGRCFEGRGIPPRGRRGGEGAGRRRLLHRRRGGAVGTGLPPAPRPVQVASRGAADGRRGARTTGPSRIGLFRDRQAEGRRRFGGRGWRRPLRRG